MGRTIHYDVFGPLEMDHDLAGIRQDVDLVQHMMNHHFTWTGEQLSLEIHDHPALTYAQRPPKPWAALVGSGFTKTRDDEWNSALVLAFLRWFSEEHPETTVRVYDEGDFIRVGHIVLRNGKPSIDTAGVERQREYLRSQHLDDELVRLDDAVTRARRGDFFADFPVADYADRREIRALCLSKDDLRQMDVRAVADGLIFPWHTEWLDRG